MSSSMTCTPDISAYISSPRTTGVCVATPGPPSLLSGFHQSLAGGHTAFRLDPITGPPGSPIPVSLSLVYIHVFGLQGTADIDKLTAQSHESACWTSSAGCHISWEKEEPFVLQGSVWLRVKAVADCTVQMESVPISDSRAGVCRQTPAYQGGPGPEPPTHWLAAQLTSALMPTLSCQSLQR